MDKIYSQLTIFFKEPFWVGVYEREFNLEYEVCKIVFGVEPKDYEVYDLLINKYNQLKFGKSTNDKINKEKEINLKRLQRIIKKQVANIVIGIKAQQSLKLQHEQSKKEKKFDLKQKREVEEKIKFELK